MKLKRIISMLAAVVMLAVSLPAQAIIDDSVKRADYEWKHMKLGPGGKITGIIFHPKEEGLIYARTDVGGIYRYDNDKSEWKQLLDFPQDMNNYYGCDGFAVDPNDPDVIYIDLGMYYWVDGGLFKSEDRGETWTKLMTIRSNGNMVKRDYSSNIAVDPQNSDIIYYGSRQKGLYRSADGGESWEIIGDVKVVSVTGDSNGIRNVAVDASSPKTADGASSVVYAGSAGAGVYRSEDGGESFTFLEGSPDQVFSLQVSGTGEVYASDDNGIFKYANGEWKDISPEPGKKYQAMQVSLTDPNTVVVNANLGNVMLMPVLITHDGGETWRNTFDSFEFHEQFGWLEDDNFSSNTTSLAIDPFNPKRVLLGDWFGIWETYDIDESHVTWMNNAKGIEELCPIGFVSPPSGDILLHFQVMDNDGLVITDLNEYPERKYTDRHLTYGAPRIKDATGLAFCETDPNIVVRSGPNHFGSAVAGYSLDGGFTWQEFETTPLEGKNGLACVVAVACEKNEDTGFPTIMWVQGNLNVKLSRDMGKTWEILPFESPITSRIDRNFNLLETDKVNKDKMYIVGKDGILHVTDDGGKTWYDGFEIPQKVNEEGNTFVKSAPGIENELWVSVADGGLYRSSDGGKTLNEIKGMTECEAFGWGKAMTGSEYPTAFVYGSYQEERGIYRSTDMGKTWVRIDPESFVLKSCVSLEGDRRNEGVVYFGHSGTGGYYLYPEGMDPAEAKVEETAIPENESIMVEDSLMPEGSFEVVENEMYVSLRKFFNMLNADVEWHSEDKSITVTRREYKVLVNSVYADGFELNNGILIDNSGKVYLNGKEYALKNKMYVKNDTTFISMNDAAELWDISVKYDEAKMIYNLRDTSFTFYDEQWR